MGVRAVSNVPCAGLVVITLVNPAGTPHARHRAAEPGRPWAGVPADRATGCPAPPEINARHR
ncbi:exported protein of unknown function [Blastococcus saxobsidens DD2]|uniref:Uncharacterized protein n=1 Tax=Blastococcus saxobsidens (strain DD2) TaxID=1146883 RepID=H6RLR3_BLASD|nr:exported protein of unknown function [Blastococcus saxobsidens DD2]